MTLSLVYPVDKRYSNVVLPNNCRKLKRIVVIFARQHHKIKENVALLSYIFQCFGKLNYQDGSCQKLRNYVSKFVKVMPKNSGFSTTTSSVKVSV